MPESNQNVGTAVEPNEAEVPVVTGGGPAQDVPGGVEGNNDWEKEKAAYEEKLKGYSDYNDYKQAATLLASFLQADPEREKAYYQWRDGGRTPAPSQKPEAPKGKDPDFVSLLEKTKEELFREIEPQKKIILRYEAEREKGEMQKKHPWFTDDMYNKLDKLFGERVEQETRTAIQEDGMNPQMARFLVDNRYNKVPLETLVFQMMPDVFLQNLASAKKQPQSLPLGMKGVSLQGVTPSAMDQAIKEYRDASPGEESAKVYKKWADEFELRGTDRDEFLKTLRGD